jgi:L-iditol 2-dehydrogenase
MHFAGHGSTDGALRSLMAWPERLLTPIPDSITDDEAPILEPLGVALHALDLAPVAAGARVGVYGCGPIGLLLVQLAKLAGAGTIVATDRLEHRVAAARGMGATSAFMVDGNTVDDISDARRRAREEEVDVAFEVSGFDQALSDAIAAVKPAGRLVIVGIPPGDRTTFEAATARRKELALQICRRMVASDLPHAVEVVAAGGVNLASLISHRYPIAQAPEAFATLAARSGLKVVVNP